MKVICTILLDPFLPKKYKKINNIKHFLDEINYVYEIYSRHFIIKNKF